MVRTQVCIDDYGMQVLQIYLVMESLFAISPCPSPLLPSSLSPSVPPSFSSSFMPSFLLFSSFRYEYDRTISLGKILFVCETLNYGFFSYIIMPP